MAKPLLAIDTILDAALELIDREGREGLSVRKLAAKLQCSPNTIYQQVGKREELITQLMQRHFSRISFEFNRADTWQQAIYEWCLALRAVLMSHPELTRLMSIRHRDFILKDVNALLKVLLGHGLDKELALQTCRVLTHLVFGYCFTELETPSDYQYKKPHRATAVAFDDLLITNGQYRSSKALDSGEVPEVFDKAIHWTIRGIEMEKI